MPLLCGLFTGVGKAGGQLAREDARLSGDVWRAVVAQHLDGTRCPIATEPPLDRLQHLSRMSDPLMPAFTTTRQAMISRSLASMTNALLTMSPSQQVNSNPSEHRRMFERIVITLPSWVSSGRSVYLRASKRLCACMMR